MERKRGVLCLCLSALQLGMIRIIGIIEIISKILPEHQALGAALRDGWTPRAPLGSSLPVHDEIPIPNWYMPQANVSEAKHTQKQAMWNGGCSHKRRASRISGCYHQAGILGCYHLAEIHSKIFSSLWSFADSEGHSKRKERQIPSGHLCRDGRVSSGRGYWLLYVLHICKGKSVSQVEQTRKISLSKTKNLAWML